MSVKLRKKQLKLFVFVALILVLFLIPAGPAYAILGINTAEVVAIVFRVLAYIFNFIGGVFLVIAGFLADLMLKLNIKILDDTNTLVHVGWRIVRDLANLGFVLVIIIIAFATILRIEQYGISKLLPKLIAAAIIVNFSFAIAAAFINFSHLLTDFFLSKVPGAGGGGIFKFSANLIDAFGPQRLLIREGEVPPPQIVEGGAGGLGTAILVSIAGLVFTIIFTMIAAFTVGAFALMLLLRYLYLTFLVILAPIVWLFWVVPMFAGQFHKWWDKFFQWVFFAPATTFFIYLALVSVEGLKRSAIEFPAGGYFGFGTVLAGIVIQGAQMVVLAGILLGGLIIAQKMGIVGAAGAVGVAKTVGKNTRAWAGRLGVRVASYPLRTVAGRRITQGLQTAGQNLGRRGRFMTAPLRQAGRGLSTLRLRSETALTKGVADRVRKRSVEENARRWAAAPNAEKVAIMSFLREQAQKITSEKPEERATAQAAIKALQSLPSRAITRDVRLRFLYGGTETRVRSGIGAEVERMIEEEAARRGGTP